MITVHKWSKTMEILLLLTALAFLALSYHCGSIAGLKERSLHQQKNLFIALLKEHNRTMDQQFKQFTDELCSEINGIFIKKEME